MRMSEGGKLVSTDEREPPQTAAERTADPRDMLTIGSRAVGDRTILSVEGELDLYTAPTLRERVLMTAGDGGRLIVDLTGVPFMDSSGLGVIVSCLKRLRESGGDLA